MRKIACLTLDLEPDLRSPDKRVRLLEDDAKLEGLLGILKKESIPLTCFTVMSLAARYGDRLRALSRGADVECAVHSFSHNTSQSASPEEVRRSWDAYCDFWNHEPAGYRSPNCLIDNDGVAQVARQGFKYDSSIVPSVRFDEYGYNNLSYGRMPFKFQIGQHSILEFPIACLAAVRLPFVFSYAKLIGMPVYRLASAILPLPDIAVTYFHPYDLYVNEIAENIPGWKRYAHLRGADRAFVLLSEFIAILKRRGYRFVKIGDLVDQFAGDAALPVVSVEEAKHSS